MTTPVALIFYENMLAGNQLVNRLKDMGYRVQLVSDLKSLIKEASAAQPLVFLVNIVSAASPAVEAVRELKANKQTKHIPVLAFTKSGVKKLPETVRNAGADLVASETGIRAQLPLLIEQVIDVE